MKIQRSNAMFFQENTVPSSCWLAGWSALVQALGISAPVHRPSCVSERFVGGSRREEGDWRIFDKRYLAGESFADHLTFALKHEDIDLLVLKRIFDSIPKAEIEQYVRATPTGIPTRRAWFFYELLTGRTLDLSDAPRATAVDALDPKSYFTGHARISTRHRVRDNLLGTGRFCPIVRKTPELTSVVQQDLSAKARDTIGRTGRHLVSRAASFLLLADSRASFELEGERPPRNRLERWGRAVMQAGRNPLTLEEILRLQRILIEDMRFIQSGLRTDGVFLGERDHFGSPLPEFIGARPADLADLMAGLLEANDRMRGDKLDPVLNAAAIAFGFVYIHPFQDGNGRIHRCLIHHVLAESQFTPPGMMFPVSSVMLDHVDEYRSTLRAHSGSLMPFIEWRPTLQGNVEVLNDTADYYRYFDCTSAAEFLYSCVARTVETDLPREIDYLRRHDDVMRRIMDSVEMPNRMAEDLVALIRRNGGRLSKKRREGEFKKLRDDEVDYIERLVQTAFEGFDTNARSTGIPE